MGGLFTLAILGLIIYMLFSKNGGMGCCGGHHDHRPPEPPRGDSTTRMNPWSAEKDDVIDLGENDYRVISPNDTRAGKR